MNRRGFFKLLAGITALPLVHNLLPPVVQRRTVVMYGRYFAPGLRKEFAETYSRIYRQKMVELKAVIPNLESAYGYLDMMSDPVGPGIETARVKWFD